MEVAAIIAAALMAIVAVFQIALSLGAPLGYAAWGGTHEAVLPVRLRIASAVAGFLIYPFLIMFVLTSADVIQADWMPGTGRVGMWIITGFFVLGGFANFASKSKRERYWGPVSWAIAVCCGIVALAL